jgi:pimeloyl-ACP methyl ester carboxylesterase
MSRRSRIVAILLAGAVSLPMAAASGSAAPVVFPSDRGGTGSAVVPELDWGPCGDDFGGSDGPPGTTFSCAWATVPLDYDRPRDHALQVALKRLEAGQPGQRIGTLFINPGGPGGSGVDFASFAWALFPQAVLDRFDVVGFDPRGVARSAPLVCFRSIQQLEDTFGGVPFFPITRPEYRTTDAAFDSYGRLCERNAGPVLDHMSTADVARDLDLLRAAVGDEGLTYAGYSYGTQLGSVYANLFPRNVRALVLDGVLDPVAWTTGRSTADRRLPFSSRLGSDLGASASLGQFFALCAQAGPDVCALAAQGDPRGVYDATMAQLRRRGPVEVDFGGGLEPVSYQDVVGASLGTFYSPFGWADLAWGVSLVAEAVGVVPAAVPSPVAAAAAVAGSFAREPMPQTFEGFEGVACSDSVNPSDREAWWDAGRARDTRAPYFGSAWTWASAGCATWPARADDRYTGPWTARTSAPVLVVGNTYDPATPYTGAQTVAKLLPGSRLLTVLGWGHTSLGSSTCATSVVGRYLVSGAMPATGTQCTFDITPFEDAVPAAARLTSGRAAAVERARAIVVSGLPGAVTR